MTGGGAGVSPPEFARIPGRTSDRVRADFCKEIDVARPSRAVPG
jgi:hypothetical protein